MSAMPARKRRSFSAEYKVEAAHRVIDSGRTIAEVARELGLNDGLLSNWVKDERRRTQAATARGDTPLDPAERAELMALRKRVTEQDKDIQFLKKASLDSRGHCRPKGPSCASGRSARGR
jgi:transposase-like protein